MTVPIPRPGKIVCVGLNYKDHAEEQGVELPAAPLLFAKFTTSLIGPGEPIVIPSLVTKCDYEAELGVVIGTTVRNVSRENALEVDLEDTAHPRDGDDDPVGDGKRPAGEARPGAARDERNPLARAQPKHRLDILGRPRKHDARRLRAPPREPVAVVGREVLGRREHVRLADRRGELVDESGRKRHRRDPTDACPQRIDHR